MENKLPTPQPEVPTPFWKSKKFIILLVSLLILIVLLGTAFTFLPKILKNNPPQTDTSVPANPSINFKTWQITLNFNTQTQRLSLKNFTGLDKEINEDFRLARYSPYQLAVYDGDKIIYQTKINITTDIGTYVLHASDAAQIAKPKEFETIIHIPYQANGKKIVINKAEEKLLEFNPLTQGSKSLIPQVIAADNPNICGSLQVVFINNGYGSINEFKQDVSFLSNLFTQTAPYSQAVEIFDFKQIDQNQTQIGCQNGLTACLSNPNKLSSTINSIGRSSFPNASTFIVLAKNSGANDGGVYGAYIAGSAYTIISKRPDISQAEFGKVAVHEFLGHAVGRLYARYIEEGPPITSLNPESNCALNPSGAPFWKQAGAQTTFNGCFAANLYAPSQRNCPDPDDGTTNSIMSAGSCTAPNVGFDTVETYWINNEIIPYFQSVCNQPIPNPNSPSSGGGLIGGSVFVDQNKNGKYDYYPQPELPYKGATILLNEGLASVQSGTFGSGTTSGVEAGSTADDSGGWFFYMLQDNKQYTITLANSPKYEITTMDGGVNTTSINNAQVVDSNTVSFVYSSFAPDMFRFGVFPKGETVPGQSPQPSGPCREETTTSTDPGGKQIQLKYLDCSPRN